MTALAIVPARGGSRGAPGKNIAPVAGKPLIAWTLEAALGAASVDRVIVSSDNEEIIEVSTSYGGEAPFVRPDELAGDDTPGIMPVLHAIEWLDKNEGYHPDLIVLLQPTSPLRTSEDIDSAFKLAVEKNAESVVSVVPTPSHPHWMKRILPDGRMEDFIPQIQVPQVRQDLTDAYALNGAVYLARTDLLISEKSFYTPDTYAFTMPPERSLDVDTPWDLHLADLILRGQKCSEMK